jgi:hypothetical protein
MAEERRKPFKPYYLLIGGEKNGDVVWWPRPDLQPCRFVIGPASFLAPIETTGHYYPYERVFLPPGGSAKPATHYRIAFISGYYQHPALDPEIAYRLLNLSPEDLAKVRVNPKEDDVED